ncbi:probable receptor-like protein kinase [Tanacetum coccineum]
MDDDPILPSENNSTFSQMQPTYTEASSPGVSEIRVVHHEDLNKRILVALIVASTLLVSILLSLINVYCAIRLKNSKKIRYKKSSTSQDAAKGLSLGPIFGLNSPLENEAVKRIHGGGPDAQRGFELSDFGLAITGGIHGKNNIKLSGTLGYVAPEYLLDGKLTDKKSDVYAFGVVLLELLIGRKPVEKMSPSQCQSIVTWAMPQLTDRSKLPNLVDPAIRDTMDLKHLYQVAAVAVLCVQPEPSYRPLITDVLH